ncbi:MAG: hypothetical protein ACTHJM_06930 [Marmoricola sp.]
MPLERVSPWPFVGLSILACTFFLYGGSLIYLHWWIVAILYVLWIPMTLSASKAFAANPRAVFPISLASLGTYLVAVGVQILTR